MSDTIIPMDRLAKVYVKIRDKISETTRDYETQIETLKAQQTEVVNAMKEQMRAAGTQSAKTEYGTVSLVTKTRYFAQDADAFKKFVLEHQVPELYEQRIAQKNMATFIAENPGLVPPGLNTVSEISVSVRKPTK